MKKLKPIVTILLVTFLIQSTLTSCTKEDDSGSSTPGKAEVQVFLTDTAGIYNAVYVEILSVEIHSDQSGWSTLKNINTGIYNLLDFSNGLDTLLGIVTLPSGKISQIRLLLGAQNSVMEDSIIYPLSTPSAMQSGLKLDIHYILSAGITYKIWLDFDAGRSIVKTGAGTYSLKPVIRAYSEAISGAIKGIVSPQSASGYVMAITGTDTAGTNPDSLGFFLIGGLVSGLYDLHFNNINGYRDTVITSVSVSNGVKTDLGILAMNL